MKKAKKLFGVLFMITSLLITSLPTANLVKADNKSKSYVDDGCQMEFPTSINLTSERDDLKEDSYTIIDKTTSDWKDALNAGKLSSNTETDNQEEFGKQDVKDRMKLVSIGEKPLKIQGKKINLFEDIYSNSDINITADYIRGYYKGSAVGKINLKGKDIEWNDKKENTRPVKISKDLISTIKKESENIEDLKVYNKKVTIKEKESCILDSMLCSDKVSVSGKEIDMPKLLYGKKDITIDGKTVNGDMDDYIIASEKGSINIKANTFFFMGYIYAPEGTVTIEADDIKYFGTIIAKEINIIGTNCSFANISHEMDYDKDLASDWVEVYVGSNPAEKDTDGDGLLDGFEINYYTELSPLKKDTDGNGILDGEEDFDKDGLSNLLEQEYNSDPFSTDTDEDNLTDYDEIEKYKTLPYEEDTDGDGINDGDEIALGLNPLNKNTYGTPDNTYEKEQIITDEKLKSFNQDNAYKLGIKVKASGNADTQMDIMESRYNESLEAFGAFIGKTVSIQYEEKFSVKGIELSFQIKQETLKKLPKEVIQDKGLKGIKRFQIFHYDEKKGTLYPIKTSYNEDKKVLKTNAEHIGEYFVVDLQQWFYELGLNNIENKKKEASRKAFSVTKKEKDKKELARKEEKAKKQIVSLKTKSKSAGSKLTVGNQQADIVFLIDTSKSMKKIIDDCKKNIGILWDMLYKAQITPRIAILELNKNSEDGANIYQAENGTPWAVSKEQANGLMKNVEIGETGTINQIDGLEIARNLSFRKNAKKYIIMITDQGIAKNQENVTGIKDIKEITKKLKKDNISTSIVCPEEKEKQFLDLAKSTKGICVDLFIDFYTNLYDWITATKETIKFQAILPDKLMLYSSGTIPAKKNNKIDTDKDGLLDSKEIDWSIIKGTGKNMKLPSWDT